jgi:hypothetical protein
MNTPFITLPRAFNAGLRSWIFGQIIEGTLSPVTDQKGGRDIKFTR